MNWTSAIYEGGLRHRRYDSVDHEFDYRLFMMYLDLDEVSRLFRNRWLWSDQNVAPAWFRRKDHIGDPEVSLKQTILKRIEDETGVRPEGPVRVLTHLRYFGYCFNPVSFFYIDHGPDQRFRWLVPEVHNTPWGDRYTYILDRQQAVETERGYRFDFDKKFHVSPFITNEDVRYRLEFSGPSDDLYLEMNSYREGEQFFDATLNMKRHEIDQFGLNTVLWKYPLMTVKVIASIYWEAWKIWRKGGTYHAHPPGGIPQNQSSDS